MFFLNNLMSNDENGEKNESDLSEDEVLENDFILEENKSKIFVKNNYLTERRNENIINTIINLHEKLGIKDDDLFEQIEKCIQYKIIDLSFIKFILENVNKSNLKDNIIALKEIYSFISFNELENTKKKFIKNIIYNIFKKVDTKNNDINFSDVLLQIKIEIVYKMFDIKNIYNQKIIAKCFEKNWNISSIISFQKKLKYFFPLKDKKIKIDLEKNEKCLMIDTIEEFIYELNKSKKIVTSESNKEITKNLVEVYTNKEDSNQYYNKNLKVINCVFEKVKYFSLKKESIIKKVLSICQKIKIEKEKNINKDIADNNEENSYQNMTIISSIDIKDKILEDIKTKLILLFNDKIIEIKEEIKFLLFVDYIFQEENWKNIILNIATNNSFNINEIFLQKNEIINMFNEIYLHELIIEKIIIEAEKVLNNFIKEIKSEFYNEKYEQNKIKRFEHILLKKCSGNIDYKTSLEITKQILSQNILNNKGDFTKDLFIINPNKKEEKNKQIQFVKIFYDSPYPEGINEIKNINEFKLKQNFEFNKDLILQDVYMVYLLRNYRNPEQRLFSDFTNGIKDIIIDVFNKSIEDITDKYDNFFIEIYQILFGKIKTYLEKEIFPNILIKMKQKEFIENF